MSKKVNNEMKKTAQKSKKHQLERKILTMLAFFSISSGLWLNFQQLWLEDNGYLPSEISTLTSVANLFAVGAIILVGWKLKPVSLQKFMTGVLVVRLLNSLAQFGLNGSGQTMLINVCTIIGIVTNYTIVASVYPLLTAVAKSNKIYSKRKLVEYLFRDVGVFIGGLLIGQSMSFFVINYNICLAVSMIFLVFAIIMMFGIKINSTATSSKPQQSAFKYIRKSKLHSLYMVYAFLASTSFATTFGLKMLILTNLLDFSASTATNYLLIAGLAGDILGMIALKYFTPKNDYITMTLKFGIRLGAYIIAVFADNPFIFLLALTWALLSETAYEDVSDGHYINLVDNQHQLGYNTVKHVMNYLGEATGVLFCGAMYNFGLGALLGCTISVMIVQIGVAYYLIYLRHHRRAVRHSASRSRYNERMVGD